MNSRPFLTGVATSRQDCNRGQIDSSRAFATDTHIVLVDYDTEYEDTLTRKLRLEGYSVSNAENGIQALDLVRSREVDLVLMDLTQPEMNGVETCRKLKGNPDTWWIPIIIMTTSSQDEDRIRGLEAGVEEYLIKPVGVGELLTRIRTSLQLRRIVHQRMHRLIHAQICSF